MPPKDLIDLRDNPRNPRKIADRARKGLEASIARFGDISGMVWNSRTRRWVCGHQRYKALKQLAAEGGVALRLESGSLVLPEHSRRGATIPERRFPIREVDWTEEEEHAANLTANNPAIQGEYTDEAEKMARELAAIDAELAQDLLITDLIMEADLDSVDDSDLKEVTVQPPPTMAWVLVGIPVHRLAEITGPLEQLRAVENITLEMTANNG